MDSHIRFDMTRKALILLDQKALPLEEKYVPCVTSDEVAVCIKDLTVRGAPAIGVSAAWGAALAAVEAASLPESADWRSFVNDALDRLEKARPTAVNLMWAVDRMRTVMCRAKCESAAQLAEVLLAEAALMQEEDVAANKAMGKFGAELFHDGDTVLTHCNAGALATAGYGTALGVIRAAIEAGKKITVIADETRPVLQGARLTAYELAKDGIPVTVACDNAAGILMQKGMVDRIVVGADRIAANGDTANKIGTYSVAVLAKEHGVPFYVAAPFSTIDPQTPNGAAIPIEERDDAEVAEIGGVRVMPHGVNAYNFAFDVTPAKYITAIITEKGVLYPPFSEAIKKE
ncbi:MAG: Methylthioribose-1-phosphate isomerase [Desulfovibrio sp.]